VPKRKVHNIEYIVLLFYASTLFITGLMVQEIKKFSGITLVSDEGVFLAYSHYLAGISLSELEQQHLAGYGQFYWIKCFFLVFPASLLNRLGITGIESLRLVIWILGAFTCLALFKLAKRNCVNPIKVLIFYFCALPLGAMIRYFGIKDSLVSGLLLLLFVCIGKVLSDNKFQVNHIRKSAGLTLAISSFFFIQHNFVLISCISLLLTAALKRELFLAFVSVGGIVIYGVLSLSVNQLSGDTLKPTQIVDFSNFHSIEAVRGGSLIPESFLQNTTPESNIQNTTPESNIQNTTPESNIQNTTPESNIQNTTPEFTVKESVNQKSSILNTKIFHLFYINFSNTLSTVVSFEGLIWLVILMFLFRTLSSFRVYPTEIVLLVSFVVLSYFGILMYDDNFGTFLRHRSSLAAATIYCLLRIRNYRLQM